MSFLWGLTKLHHVLLIKQLLSRHRKFAKLKGTIAISRVKELCWMQGYALAHLPALLLGYFLASLKCESVGIVNRDFLIFFLDVV